MLAGGGLAAWGVVLLLGGGNGVHVELPESALPCPVEVAGHPVDLMRGHTWAGGDFDGKASAHCHYGAEPGVTLEISWVVAGRDPSSYFCGYEDRDAEVRADGTLFGRAVHATLAARVEHAIDPGLSIDRDSVWHASDVVLEALAPHAGPCPGG